MSNLFFPFQHLAFSITPGQELLKAYQLNPQIPFKFGCTKGQCGVCAIRVIQGQEHLSKMTKQEKDTLVRLKLSSEHRLVCQCAILGDVSLQND